MRLAARRIARHQTIKQRRRFVAGALGIQDHARLPEITGKVLEGAAAGHEHARVHCHDDGAGVFTDGRANVPLSENGLTNSAALKDKIRNEILCLGASLREAGVTSLVVDTQSRFTSNGEGRFLSDALGGRYVRLPQLISGEALTEMLEGVGV